MQIWLKRLILTSLPVAAFSLWIGFVPWFLCLFYYLSLWMVFYSKDEYGHSGGSANSSDLLGGPY